MTEASRGWRLYLAAGIASLASVGSIALLQGANPRVLASWHGFLHAGIVERIRLSGWPPENPYFAGEPLPYYWIWHAVTAVASEVSGLDTLHSFQWLTLASLVLLWVVALRIGTARSSTGGGIATGLLVGWLALVGSTPLGPVLAFVRSAINGTALFETTPAAVETLRVSNAVADQWMTHPLVGALFWNWDWRIGPNAVWFWDNSSRAAALAFLLVLAGMAARRRLSVPMSCVTALVTAVVAALNPLIGVAAGLSLAGSAVVVGVLRREPERWRLALAIALGLLVAVPSYVHILGGGTGGVGIRWLFFGALLAITFAMGPIWAFAVAGARRAAQADQHGETVLLLAGTVLLGGSLFLHLAEGNEHNLVNAALVVLAVPAANWTAAHLRRSIGLGLVFLPIALASFVAFTARPPIPIEMDGTSLLRTDAIRDAYRFLRHETPADAVVIDDPDQPLRMAGNVGELPAFTGRALWIDHPSYLTLGFSDFDARTGIARKLLAGEPLSAAEYGKIRALDRPLYLLRTDGGSSEQPPVVFEAHGITIQQVQ